MRDPALLNSLIDELKALPYGDDAQLDALLLRAESLIRQACGDHSPYLAALRRLRFRPYSLPAIPEYQHSLWRVSAQALLDLLQALRADLRRS
jgi:hypothetical protein